MAVLPVNPMVPPGATEPRPRPVPVRAHAATLALVAVATVCVLVVSAAGQFDDSTFYALSQANSILAGDRPYRDFFEPGLPLDTYMAAAVQSMVGYRVIGEFARQWAFIVAGYVIACHLGLRLSGSVPATVAMMSFALLLLPNIPLYHHSKLFFFPLTIWAGWRYLDRPNAARASALGLVAALGFLFRHDYGVYIGAASVVAFALVRVAAPGRTLPSLAADVAAYAVVVAVTVAPWAMLVQANEGLLDYARARAALYQRPAGVYGRLTALVPIRRVLNKPAPAAVRGDVALMWIDSVDDARRVAFERDLGLRLVEPGGSGRPWRYAVPNLYDSRLLRLQQYVFNTEGFDWGRLEDIGRRLPSRDDVEAWLQQMAVVVSVLLTMTAAVQMWRSRRREPPVPETWQMFYAGTFLGIVALALFREASYFVVVAPVCAALSSRLILARTASRRVGAAMLVVPSVFAGWVWSKGTILFRPSEYVDSVTVTMGQLMASPPEYVDPRFRYVRECTTPGDRIIITGPTPLHVSYFSQRPLAGGHANWHHGWRTAPRYQAESLALLERQSVPLAISTSDPVIDDFRGYPRIRDYLMKHYVAVEGSDGLVLVDTRRTPTGRHAATGFPCFA